jgi:hypothetical protein
LLFKFKAILAGSLLAYLSCASADEGSDFPVPRAEAEFANLMDVPLGYASQGVPPLDRVLGAMMPYGPLDLQITGEATHKEISDLKNFYFGVSTQILGVSPSILSVVTNCNKKCLTFRREDIAAKLEAWAAVAEIFRVAKGVHFLGAWGGQTAFRVNDVINAGERVTVAVPSAQMGFIPGGRFIQQASLNAALSERNIESAQVIRILEAMADAGATAVHYGSAGCVEVIKIGLVDNLSGVLFVADGQAAPAKGDEHPNGGHYSTIEKIAANAYFFETR